jgi:uncharacterized iron-regulated membrane protein
MVAKKISFKKVFILIFFLISTALRPQAEMADAFRSDGKIYVVIGVIAVVLLALLAFLFWIDRKVNNTIQNIKKDKETAGV